MDHIGIDLGSKDSQVCVRNALERSSANGGGGPTG